MFSFFIALFIALSLLIIGFSLGVEAVDSGLRDKYLKSKQKGDK